LEHDLKFEGGETEKEQKEKEKEKCISE